MFERLKVNTFFNRLMGRPDIDKAYAMVGPEDSWYDTITKVHNSLKEIQELLKPFKLHSARTNKWPGTVTYDDKHIYNRLQTCIFETFLKD